ncbi:electroneutral sodium bicarbonate exchanger 1 [Diaphorina citri]|uniref:Electroneutral sodium bicarbonate exchanger 1 n=1 Tax=Diaphorina citri TaxID=121845 RepID=A0A3Q0IXM0_DIACI|nr:electroneutral sodium bicarbonate exchanger 1 [Diaphorina citri]
MLDLEANSLEQIVDLFIEKLRTTESIPDHESQEKVREALLQRHRHQHERRKDKDGMRLPIIRSLADIGKNHSSSKRTSSTNRPLLSLGKYVIHVIRIDVDDVTSQSKPSAPLSGNFLSIPGSAHGGAPVPDPGGGMPKSVSSHSMYRNHSGGDLNSDHKCNTHFMRKIPPGSEAANILVGELAFIDKILSGFIRLKDAVFLGDLTEVSLPSRFIFILLGPASGVTDLHEVGRAMATLMSDDVFHEVAYKARNRTHLLAAMDEFLDAGTVLPPGEWDPAIRIEPPAAIPSQDVRKRPSDRPKDEQEAEFEEQKLREESGLSRSGVLFGGLINDIRRKTPWYWSDFKDALALQCVASWIFLYFACLSPIITFGGLLSEATNSNMAAMESLVSGFVCGMGYGFFSGQPLTILGSTGPVLVFETIVFDFCKQNSWDYMSFSLQRRNGTLVGVGCTMSPPVPDVFLMSVLLFLGTFILSVELKDFKNALFFPSKIRQFISDFAVIIAISSMTYLDFLSGIKTPKLEVPSDFKPTSPDRTWVISPWKNPAYTWLLAILPAILGTILIFMDQQITAVITVITESDCAAPGEKPTFLGVREQRVTHILIFLMIGLSVLITPWLRYIPMPVLFGVFLYMGVASLKGLQFFDRILILFIPVKYQPDYMFLRQVSHGGKKHKNRSHKRDAMSEEERRRLSITAEEEGEEDMEEDDDDEGIMIKVEKNKNKQSYVNYVDSNLDGDETCVEKNKNKQSYVNYVDSNLDGDETCVHFQLVVMIGIRKLLDCLFTQRELKILDDVMPETIKRSDEEISLEVRNTLT